MVTITEDGLVDDPHFLASTIVRWRKRCSRCWTPMTTRINESEYVKVLGSHGGHCDQRFKITDTNGDGIIELRSL
jgi:hypothetical protein